MQRSERADQAKRTHLSKFESRAIQRLIRFVEWIVTTHKFTS
jgi:hypothetical protein